MSLTALIAVCIPSISTTACLLVALDSKENMCKSDLKAPHDFRTQRGLKIDQWCSVDVASLVQWMLLCLLAVGMSIE